MQRCEVTCELMDADSQNPSGILVAIRCARSVGERLSGGWDTAKWASPPVCFVSSIAYIERKKKLFP